MNARITAALQHGLTQPASSFAGSSQKRQAFTIPLTWRHFSTALLRAVLLGLTVLSTTLFAAIDATPSFDTAEQEAQYYSLIKEIRCPTCQNNNIAESNAPLARQLREQIILQIQQGKSNSEISDYLIARYGDFVTYRPPFNARTWLLWLLPATLMLIALVVWIIVRGRQRQIAALSPEQQLELQRLLMENRKSDDKNS